MKMSFYYGYTYQMLEVTTNTIFVIARSKSSKIAVSSYRFRHNQGRELRMIQ